VLRDVTNIITEFEMRYKHRHAGCLCCVLAVCLLIYCQAFPQQLQVSREIQAVRTSQLQTAINTLAKTVPKAQKVQLTVSAALGHSEILVDSPISIPSGWAASLEIIGRALQSKGKLVELICSSKLSKEHLSQAIALGSSVLQVGYEENQSVFTMLYANTRCQG
jgi:hypothetical protein